MSMPSFPEIDPEITCERALNMILASIAMEELALSHIINAEGEKIQYVLGTLKSSCGRKPDIDEILKVNHSVTCLLDSVSQNQMILKNKMDKAIHALSDVCPNPPGPPGPPSSICACKCTASFNAAEKCLKWREGSALPWKAEHLHGRCFCINNCDKTKIALCTRGRFAVSFSVNVKAKDCKCNAAVSLQMIRKHQHKDIYTVYSPLPCGDEAVTISMGGIIIEKTDNHEPSALLLKLESPDSLSVEDSMLSIMEV